MLIVAPVFALIAAMPTGANAYIFAVQYQGLVNPVSGAVALGLLAALTLPVVVWVVAARQRAQASAQTRGYTARPCPHCLVRTLWRHRLRSA